MRITAVTPMKNEGPFILEWLAYHRLIGINDFLCFTNDCEDGTDLILERLDELGYLRHLPNPSVVRDDTGGHHWAAMAYVNAMPRLRRSDWYVSFDVDEFICVNTGKGTLPELMKEVKGADLISMNQVNFGCAGRIRFDPSTPLIGQFDRAMSQDNADYAWDRARGIKTFVRGGAPIARIGNHAPELREGAKVKWLNGDGKKLPEELFSRQFKSLRGDLAGHGLVQLNHYAVRAMENFLVKTERGDANRPIHEDVKYWRQYWNQYDDNLVQDTSIQRWTARVEKAVERMLDDAELARLHAASVTWHRKAIARLRKAEPQATILAQIKGLHDRKLNREEVARDEAADAA